MDKQIQKKQQEAALIPHQHSQRLMRCITALENPSKHTDAKMMLMNYTSELMPEGRPNFRDVIRFPKMKIMIAEYGRGTMQKVLFLMIKDFCDSLNVVRNMNEDQIIECAATLLDECDNFRLEDYVMFFAGAKRGRFNTKTVRILDHIDIQIILEMLNEYYLQRKTAGQRLQEEPVKYLDSLGPVARQRDMMNPQDAELMESVEGIGMVLSDMKESLKSKLSNNGQQDSKIKQS